MFPIFPCSLFSHIPYFPISHVPYFPYFLGCGWSELFPGVLPHLLTLLIQFWIPGHRELGYWSEQKKDKDDSGNWDTLKKTKALTAIPFQAGRMRSLAPRHGEPAEDQEGDRDGAGARGRPRVPQRGEGPDQAGAQEEEGVRQAGHQARRSSCPHLLVRRAESV